MEPAVAKGGMAVALSLGAGYFFSQLRSRQPIAASSGKPHRRPLVSSSDAGEAEEGKRTGGGGVQDRVGVAGFEEASLNFRRGTLASFSSIFGQFPSVIRPPGSDLGYTMVEFDELVQEEFGLMVNHENNEVVNMKQEITDLKKSIKSLCDREANLENQILELNNLREQELVVRELENQVKIIDLEIEELKEREMKIGKVNCEESEEVAELKNYAKCSRETEAKLEIQMMEYNNLKDQMEAVVMELENRLKIADLENKLSVAKMEAVENENRNLKAQALVAISELDAEREKIKILKRNMRTNSRLAKEKVSHLYRKIAELQRNVGDIDRNLDRLKDLEDEVADLRKENSRLAQENLDLTKKLESTPAISSSTISEVSEADDVREEMTTLKQVNEELTNQIQQIRIEQCADLEQAVYLRWINACLRYELRNYQPPPGKVAARDLNKSPSLRSAQKAKELILEYANSINDEEIGIDLPYKPSSHLTPPPPTAIEIEEIDDDFPSITTEDDHLTNKRPRFLGKLKKIVLGKHTHNHNSSSDAIPTRRVAPESIHSKSAAEARYGGEARVVGVTTEKKTEVPKFTSGLKNSTSSQWFCRC